MDKEKSIWGTTILEITYKDIEKTYRGIKELDDEVELTDEQEQEVLYAAHKAGDWFEPYDLDYQLKVFVEENLRLMKER